MEESDLRYLWAAYKKGNLVSMGGSFATTDMEVDEFTAAFAHELSTNYHRFWTLLAETSKGFIPVGAVLAFWSHPDPKFAPFMTVGDMLWMPWATARNRIESAVNFFNVARCEVPFVEYARQKDKRFFDVLAAHKVMHRVGTSHNIYAGEAAAIYETSSPTDAVRKHVVRAIGGKL